MCFLCRAGPTRSNTDQLRFAVDRDFVAVQGRQREEKREGDENNRLPRVFSCRSENGYWHHWIARHTGKHMTVSLKLKSLSIRLKKKIST